MLFKSFSTVLLSSVAAFALSAAILYSQPPSPGGGLYHSSWWDPNGSDYDQYVWDGFTLQSTEVITEVQWRGGYDPTYFGSGGPVVDFTVAIYPSIVGGSQPVVLSPLVEYQAGGNAGETVAGTFGGMVMYDYSFPLPMPFTVTAGIKYWVQIEAWQHGIPDWGIAVGTDGDGKYFRRIANVGDIFYQLVPGDAAFTLLGPEVPISGLSATNDSPTALGQATILTATISAGSGVSYVWDWGDQATGSGQVISHTYAAIGSYTAVVTASNSLGAITATTAVTITDAPISGLTASNDGPMLFGNPSTLSANVATGSNIVYEWSLGDGELGSGPVVTHTYPHAGWFTATVTATNSASGPVTATTVVEIASAEQPIEGLSASNDSPTQLGGMTTLTASVTLGSSVTYMWNLGDGEIRAGKVVTHGYARFGTFTAIVTAANSLSQMSASTSVTVTAPYHIFLPVVLRSPSS